MNKIIDGTIFMAVFFSLLSPVSYAQESAPNNGWKYSGHIESNDASLNTYEAKLKYWKGLTEEQRQAFRERAQSISLEQLKLLRKRQERFNRLPIAERERIMNNYQQFRQLPSSKRAELERRYQHFQKLPKNIKMELRRKVFERRSLERIDERRYIDRDKVIRARNEVMMRRREDMKKIGEERRKRNEEMIRRRENINKLQVGRRICPPRSQGVRPVHPSSKRQIEGHGLVPVVKSFSQVVGSGHNAPVGESLKSQ